MGGPPPSCALSHRLPTPQTCAFWQHTLHPLQNNTTPDDVPICEAYLAFLQSNGSLGEYWRVLSDAGEPGGLATEYVVHDGPSFKN